MTNLTVTFPSQLSIIPAAHLFGDPNSAHLAELARVMGEDPPAALQAGKKLYTPEAILSRLDFEISIHLGAMGYFFDYLDDPDTRSKPEIVHHHWRSADSFQDLRMALTKAGLTKYHLIEIPPAE